MPPDATIALGAAVALFGFGCVVFYVSDTWHDEEMEDAHD